MSTAFAHDLARFGPGRLEQPLRLAASQAYCQALTHSHYENFSVASLLLPRRLLPHFHAIYAYCRWADDLADEVADGNEALDLLRWWRQELLRCYDGQPRHPVMVALQPTIRRFGIPRQPFLDLLLAFEQDQSIKRYETYEELAGYCRNSANPVGHLVLYLAEVFDARRAALSDCICTGLQLANFWQDVARDLDIGRVYLPQEDCRRFGYSDDDLNARRFTPAFAELLRFEVDRTRQLFQQGLPLIDLMPADLQADIELFARGGLAILRKIEQAGYNVWVRRPALAKWEKGALLLGVLWRRLRCVLPVW
jgi:squalene synthase HpnC